MKRSPLHKIMFFSISQEEEIVEIQHQPHSLGKNVLKINLKNKAKLAVL